MPDQVYHPTAVVAVSQYLAQLYSRIAELEAERDTYRELAQEAINALSDLTKRHRSQTARLIEALERFRAVP